MRYYILQKKPIDTLWKLLGEKELRNPFEMFNPNPMTETHYDN